MEDKCQYCGITEKERENLIVDKNILRLCEDCLKDESLNLTLDQFFLG